MAAWITHERGRRVGDSDCHQKSSAPVSPGCTGFGARLLVDLALGFTKP